MTASSLTTAEMSKLSNIIAGYAVHPRTKPEKIDKTVEKIQSNLLEVFVTITPILYREPRALKAIDPHLLPGRGCSIKDRIHWVAYDHPGSTFTDPTQFNPKKFQFIVHVIGPNAPNYKETLKNPEKTFQNRLLSCSLINQEKYKTFILDCGLIFRVPESSIYAATPCDMFLHNKAVDQDLAESHLKKRNKHEHLDEELTRVNTQFGMSTPEDILNRTQRDKINEVAVLGENVKVIGIFRKVLISKGNKKSYPGCDKRIFPLLEKLAQIRKLPLVEIPISYQRAKK